MKSVRARRIRRIANLFLVGAFLLLATRAVEVAGIDMAYRGIQTYPEFGGVERHPIPAKKEIARAAPSVRPGHEAPTGN